MQAYHIIVVITVLVSFWVSEGLLLVPLSNHMRAKRTSFFCSPTNEGNAPLKRLFIFGLGYVGAELATALAEESQFIVSGTCTNIKKMESLQKIGIRSYLFDAEAGKMFQSEALEDLSLATHILCTIPPSLETSQDPVLALHGNDIKRAAMSSDSRLEWLGYLSSTGVYGDREGAWVTEEDEVRPTNRKTKIRFAVEQQWMNLFEKMGLPVHVFRLAGIYGPGRSAIDTLNKAGGDMSQCGANDQVSISRIHVQDIVTVLKASMANPSPGLLINVADDLPSTRYEVLSFACRLLNYPIQKPDKYVPEDGESVLGIRGGSKRVDNSKMRNLLLRAGADLKYSDFRSGLQALYFGDYYHNPSSNSGESSPPLRKAEEEDGDNDEGTPSMRSPPTAPIKSSKRAAIQRTLNNFARSSRGDGGESVDRVAVLEQSIQELQQSNENLKDIVTRLTEIIKDRIG